MKYLLWAFPLLLTACSKNHLPLSTSTPDYSRTLFVGAGQSNMSAEHLGDTFLYSSNVALGGSALDQWKKGTPLYDQMKQAIGTYPQTAILWWQGESEGLHSGGYPWAANFIQMVRDIRTDTGFRLPVVYVQIGTTTLETSMWTEIREQQIAAEHQAPDLRVITIDDLGTPRGDGQIHYSQDQYHTVQKRMLAAYLSLMQ